MLAELLFVAGSLVLLFAGARLAHYGEAIAEKAGVSATWIGLFLVASVTSLPELFAGLTSILAVDSPDLAVGTVLGSCLFNLGLAALALLALRHVATDVNDARVYRVGSAYVGLMLLAVGSGVGLATLGVRRPLGAATAILVVLYLVAIRHVFHVQARRDLGRAPAQFDAVSGRRVALLYAVNSAIVVAVATALPVLAERISLERGIEESFVGTAFLAVSTSLPELVIVLAAFRRRAPGLAIGGLVGSNLFDLVILAIDDLFYVKGPLLAAVDAEHLLSVGAIGIATALFVAAVPTGRPPRIAPAAGVLVAYALAIFALGYDPA